MSSAQGRGEFIFVTLNSCTCSTKMSEHLLVSRAKLWRQYMNKGVSTFQGSLIPLGVNRWLGYSVACSRQASRGVVLKLRHKGKSAWARQRSGRPQQRGQPEQRPGGSDEAAFASACTGLHWVVDLYLVASWASRTPCSSSPSAQVTEAYLCSIPLSFSGLSFKWEVFKRVKIKKFMYSLCCWGYVK